LSARGQCLKTDDPNISVMRIVLIVLGVLVGLVLVVVVIGWSLPVAHVATASVQLKAPPDSVFALISQPGDYPSWRTDVTKVDVTTEQGLTRFREDGSNGSILFEITERIPPRRLVTRIADKSLPFGGRWIYEVAPAGAGSTLQITEEGEVYNPVFRFVSRFVMGHTSTIDGYLAAVQKRLGGA
jgi:uncharacterized protein YndB with AHSA1/START domain